MAAHTANGHTVRNRFKLACCECGCEKAAAWNLLHPLKAPDGRRYFVLDDCRDAFTNEVMASQRLNFLVESVRGVSFWRRWRYSRLFALLILQTHERHEGKAAALRRARRSAFLFCAPAFIGHKVAAHWRKRQAVEHGKVVPIS